MDFTVWMEDERLFENEIIMNLHDCGLYTKGGKLTKSIYKD